MKKLFGMFCLFFQSVVGHVEAQNRVQIQRGVTLMGSKFGITVVEKDSAQADKMIDVAIKEIERVENLISEWRPHTQISQVNLNAGIKAVTVDREVFDLTKRAILYSVHSGGAFDISTAAMDRVWKFDGSMIEVPSKEVLLQTVRNVGYKKIVIDSLFSTIYLKEKGMKIGFGSIGKGYAADRAREVLQKMGVSGGMIDASGDISTWGTQITGEPWIIGVKNPKKNGIYKQLLKFTTNAVATSGNYQKYAEINGVRYSHIINPITGMPATGLISVTVYGPSCEIANALSTSIMVLGKRNGKKLLQKYPEYRAIYIKN